MSLDYELDGLKKWASTELKRSSIIEQVKIIYNRSEKQFGKGILIIFITTNYASGQLNKPDFKLHQKKILEEKAKDEKQDQVDDEDDDSLSSKTNVNKLKFGFINEEKLKDIMSEESYQNWTLDHNNKKLPVLVQVEI